MRILLCTILPLLSCYLGFSQEANHEKIQAYERDLEYYFRRDKYRKAQKAYEWLWANNSTHSPLFYQTGILLYDYLLHEGRESKIAHYQQMLDTLRTLTDADPEAIYDERFNAYGAQPQQNPWEQLPPVPVLAQEYDIAPYYDGGMEAFAADLYKHLNFPAILQRYGAEARVFVSLVIEADGEVDHVHVLQGITPEVDAQITEAVQLTPGWIPAQKRGESVPVRVVVPINFRYR